MAELTAMLEKKAAVIKAGGKGRLDLGAAADDLSSAISSHRTVTGRGRAASVSARSSRKSVAGKTATQLNTFLNQDHVQDHINKPDLAVLRNDIKGVKTEVATVKTELGKVKSEVYKLTDEIRGMKVGIQTIQGMLARMSGDSAADGPPRFFA